MFRRRQRSVEDLLRANSQEIRRVRDELAVLDEQVVALADDADDLATRAVTSDDRSFGPEARTAREHVDTINRERARLRAKLAELDARQDQLLDRLG